MYILFLTLRFCYVLAYLAIDIVIIVFSYLGNAISALDGFFLTNINRKYDKNIKQIGTPKEEGLEDEKIGFLTGLN